MREELDDDESAWRSFLACWFATFGNDPVRVRELVDAIRPTMTAQGEPRSTPLRDALPESLDDPDDRHLGGRLGTALRERRDRIIGDYRLRRAGQDRHTKAHSWYVDRIPAAEGADGAEGNFGYARGTYHQNISQDGNGSTDPPHPPHPPQPDREPGEDYGEHRVRGIEREPGDDDPLLDLAESCGWPCVPLAPGLTIVGTDQAWQAFAASA
jgi:hypothetical protein